MEPEKNVPGTNPVNKDEADSIQKTASSLHDEGVDIIGDDRLPEYAEGDASKPAASPTPPRFAVPAPQPAAAPAWMPSASTFVVTTPPPKPEPQQPIENKPIEAAPQPVPAAPAPATPAPKIEQPEPVRPIAVPIAAQPAAAPARNAQSDIDMILGGSAAKPVAAPTVQNDPSIKPLRTFKTDAEEAIRHQNISAAQIAVAEQKKREAAAAQPAAQQKEGKKGLGIGIALIAILFLALAGGGAYYYRFYVMTSGSAPTTKVPSSLKVSSLVPYDAADIVKIEPDENAVAAIALSLSSAPIQIGETFVAVPVPLGTTTIAATVATVLSDTRIPPMLERSLAPQYTVGTRLFKANSPFIVLKNTFFQNAYAGMLEWEGHMRSDFAPLIRLSHPEEPAVELASGSFTDSVVSNTDTRVLRNGAGDTILAYAFADRDTIVIATDEETLSYLLDKLLAVRVVQ